MVWRVSTYLAMRSVLMGLATTEPPILNTMRILLPLCCWYYSKLQVKSLSKTLARAVLKCSLKYQTGMFTFEAKAMRLSFGAFVAVFLSVLLMCTVLIAIFANTTRLDTPTPAGSASPSAATSSPTSAAPSPYPYTKVSPTYYSVLSQYEFNIFQGETFEINVTITNLLNDTRSFMPLVQLAVYNNSQWDSNRDSSNIYNAVFSKPQLTLEPNTPTIVTLTIAIKPEALPGKYLFYVTNVDLDVTIAQSPSQSPNPTIA
jgi:hypothetical protein